MSNEVEVAFFIDKSSIIDFFAESICALSGVNVDHLVIFTNDITLPFFDPRNSPRDSPRDSPRMGSVYEKRIMPGKRAG